MEYVKIGKKIREKRQKKGYTQSDLADSIGVTWEMVSRYERGESSPLNQIDALSKALNTTAFDLLQDYYNSSDSHSIDSMINNIPYFVSVPKDLKFNISNTTHFYNAPIWLTKKDKDVFAVDGGLVTVKSVKVLDPSILYISKDAEMIDTSIVLCSEKSGLIVDIYSKVADKSTILGTVLAYEVRV